MAGSENRSQTVWYDPAREPMRINGLAFFGENNENCEKTQQKNREYENVAEAQNSCSASFAHDFSRMPESKKELFEKVNKNLVFLGTHPAGGQIRFRTDSKSISIKARIAYAHDMCNMPASGQCGFDLYVKYEGESEYEFLGMTNFDEKATEYESCLSGRLRAGMKSIIINMPLYVPLLAVAVGLDGGSVVEKPEDFGGKPFVVYGTSITQGGCVSRPGTCYSSLLSRRFGRETFNFGFSANGLGEYEMAELIRDLPDSGLVILDYEANAGSNGRLEKSLEGFIKIIREKQKCPILVLSRIPYILDAIEEEFGSVRRRCREFARGIVRKFNDGGDKKVYFADGYELFDGCWKEYTVDLIHPTDAGHIKMADKLEKIIKEII